MEGVRGWACAKEAIQESNRPANNGGASVTKTPTRGNSMGSDDRQCDHLTVINGISPTRQDKLKEFGICTLEDLATITDEVAESVAKDWAGVSANMVKDWCAKAQKELSSRHVTEEEEANTDDEANSPPAENEWKSFATFVVVVQARPMKDGPRDLRLKVHHKDTDEHAVWPDEDKEWPGIRSTQFWEWIVAQVGETEEALPTVKKEARVELTSAESSPPPVPQAKVKVTQIHAYQPADAKAPIPLGKAGNLFRGTVQASEPFALEASFELVETTGAELAKERGTYCAKFYARNRSTGECIHLNNTEPQPLVGNKLPHTAKLDNVTLSPGNYKLQVLVQLECLAPILGYLEVPLLHVV